jgi:hypothetical protein
MTVAIAEAMCELDEPPLRSTDRKCGKDVKDERRRG